MQEATEQLKLGSFCRNCGRKIEKKDGTPNFKRVYCDRCRAGLKVLKLQKQREAIARLVKDCPHPGCPMRRLPGRPRKCPVLATDSPESHTNNPVPVARNFPKGHRPTGQTRPHNRPVAESEAL